MYESTLFYDYVNELFDIIFSASIDLGLAKSDDEHKQIRCKQGISRMLLNILDNIPSELIGDDKNIGLLGLCVLGNTRRSNDNTSTNWESVFENCIHSTAYVATKASIRCGQPYPSDSAYVIGLCNARDFYVLLLELLNIFDIDGLLPQRCQKNYKEFCKTISAKCQRADISIAEALKQKQKKLCDFVIS